MEKKMEWKLGLRVYILGLNRDNGKENGNYFIKICIYTGVSQKRADPVQKGKEEGTYFFQQNEGTLEDPCIRI